MKLIPPLKNKTTPIKAGIKIIESRIGYEKRIKRFPLNECDSEVMMSIIEGINKDIDTIEEETKSFFDICFENGFK